VERIEKVTVLKPKHRIITRYLVTRRPAAQEKKPEEVCTQVIGTPAHEVFTDAAAIGQFERVLRRNHDGNDSRQSR
jgi:hypothetical protein